MYLNFARWLFHSSDIYPFILQWWVTIAMIGVFIGYFFLIIKKPLGFNTKIHKKTWLILGIFVLLFLIVNLNFNSFRAADEEWASIYRAKTMIDGNKRVYVNDYSGIVFPLLVAGLLKISNSYIPLIRIFNIVLGTISLFFIFECAYLIFDNEKASLLSVFVYVLTPWAYYYTGIVFGLPTLVHFLSLLSLLTILLAFKYHKLSLHLCSLMSLLVLNQTKIEYYPYYLIYLIIFFVTKEYKRFKKKEIILFMIIAFLCFIPTFSKNALFKISYSGNPNWCGFPTQTIKDYSYGAIIMKVDNLLQNLINKRIKLSYFLGDLPIFFNFWSQSTLVLPIALSLIGICLSFKEYPHKKLFLWFPILFFLSLAIVYLLDCDWYEARHAISTYGFLTIFSGYCLWWLLSKTNLIKVGKFLTYFTLIFLLCIQSVTCIKDLRNYQKTIQWFPFEFRLYYFYKDLMKDISNQSVLCITLDNNSKYILRLLGYQAESLNDYIQSNEAAINYKETINRFFSSGILELSNKIYFVDSPICDLFDFFVATCNRAQNESKGTAKELYIHNQNSKIQLLILK